MLSAITADSARMRRYILATLRVLDAANEINAQVTIPRMTPASASKRALPTQSVSTVHTLHYSNGTDGLQRATNSHPGTPVVVFRLGNETLEFPLYRSRGIHHNLRCVSSCEAIPWVALFIKTHCSLRGPRWIRSISVGTGVQQRNDRCQRVAPHLIMCYSFFEPPCSQSDQRFPGISERASLVLADRSPGTVALPTDHPGLGVSRIHSGPQLCHQP